MHLSGCGCAEQIVVSQPCGCTTTPPVASNCRQPLSPEEVGPLLWVYGLDAANCRKYQAISSVLGLIDCDGSPISAATPLVTCALFSGRLCTSLAALAAGGVAGPATQLVGKDCLTYTIPPASSFSVLDTQTVNLTLAGSVLTADVIVAPTVGNQLVATPTGLFVNAPSGITVADTPCINLDLVASVLTATPIISSEPCNALTCELDGLYAPDSTSAGLMTVEALQFNQAIFQGSVIDLPLITLNIVNPSDCRPAILSLHLQTPAICTEGVDPTLTTFQLLLQRNLAPVYSEAEFVLTTTSFNKAGDSDAAYDRGWVYTVPAGFAGNVTARVRINQITGNLTNVQVVSPVLRYHLSTI